LLKEASSKEQFGGSKIAQEYIIDLSKKRAKKSLLKS